MKKLFLIATTKVLVCMTVIAAMAMTSCSKEDDDNDSERVNFANRLTQNSLSGTWEGWHKKMIKEDIWKEDSKQYAVIRFFRSSNTSTNGTGVVLYFTDETKKNYKEGTDFNWYLDDNQLKIRAIHRNDWNTNNGSNWMYAEYNTTELTISGNSFYGHWVESVTYKWAFDYKKSDFNDWTKYSY